MYAGVQIMDTDVNFKIYFRRQIAVEMYAEC